MRTISTGPKMVFRERVLSRRWVYRTSPAACWRRNAGPTSPSPRAADEPGGASAAPRGPWSAAATQSGGAGVLGQEWTPTKPPAGRIRGPLVWWRGAPEESAPGFDVGLEGAAGV